MRPERKKLLNPKPVYQGIPSPATELFDRCAESLQRLSRLAFTSGLDSEGLFFAQLALFVVRLRCGISVSDASWASLAEILK